MNCTSASHSHSPPQATTTNNHPPQQQQTNAVAVVTQQSAPNPLESTSPEQNGVCKLKSAVGATEVPLSSTTPLSSTREQQEICLSACAPSNAHLSELDEEEGDNLDLNADELPDAGENNNNDGSDDDDDEGSGQFPYSSGSSPVIHHSFRLAVRQSRAPSTCGKFNESLLGSLAQDPERIKSTLCVCTSIRHPRSGTTTTSGIDGAATADADGQQQQQQLPTKERPITDEYKISHEIIGVGESGKVMVCFHKRSGEKFALKVLRNSPRSRREIELHWRSCRHPHVVSIVDMFENTFDGLQCLLVVVEFMQGGDLLTLFEANGRNPYSERCVARIVKQIGSAVQFLHERNVAHRDIKLENILCSFNNVHQCTFKLADFGFAKQCDRPMDSPCCTPAYVCPEILSYKQYDKSCDIWALGVVTYILLCGYPPFYSMQGLPFSPGMRTRITAGLFAFPDEDWDGVTDYTKHMISLMLKTEPGERINIQQLMSSEFLSTVTQSKMATKVPALVTQSTLPPVSSDSSLSSDAGFESTDSKDTNSSGGSASAECQAENNGGGGGKEVQRQQQQDQGGSRPSAQFFVGSAYVSAFASQPPQKSNSARQMWGGGSSNVYNSSNSCTGTPAFDGGRPAALPRERTYSIQEQVDRALTLMRMGGRTAAEIGTTLKNPSRGLTGSKLLERRRSGKIPAAVTAIMPAEIKDDKLEVKN